MRDFLVRFVFLGFFLLSSTIIPGCGGSNKHKVTGKVHFADGSPLTTGRIVAELSTGKMGASGYIRPDGTFELGTAAMNDGLPPGTWDVVIVEAVLQPEVYADKPNVTPPTPLINARFANKDGAKLSFKVPEQLKWDITVEKP